MIALTGEAAHQRAAPAGAAERLGVIEAARCDAAGERHSVRRTSKRPS